MLQHFAELKLGAAEDDLGAGAHGEAVVGAGSRGEPRHDRAKAAILGVVQQLHLQLVVELPVVHAIHAQVYLVIDFVEVHVVVWQGARGAIFNVFLDGAQVEV